MSAGLDRRFAEHPEAGGLVRPGARLVVGVSGGLDSVVLLHLLRFAPLATRPVLVAAHVDHALRPGSDRDADWVAGLCRAWGVPLERTRLEAPPADEAEARSARWAWLDEVRRAEGAHAIVTAHHADDQVETVLFRVLRGTGIRGLAGMRPYAEGRMRPLLPFRRSELEEWADHARLDWRPDPSNLDLRWARNVLRHRLLPLAEADVHPGTRDALLRLARNAARAQEALDGCDRALAEAVIVQAGPARIVLAAPGLLAYDRALRARVVRACARRLGVDLPEAGTRVAMEFTSRSASGRGVDLPGGLHLRRDFDRFVLARSTGSKSTTTAESEPLVIPGVSPGSGEVCVGGRRIAVRWGGEPPAAGHSVALDAARLRFPLRVREWRHGDRMRLPYGSKKLAKLFAEARVARPERGRLPVVTDAADRVLWVPGVARSAEDAPAEGRREFYIGVENADSA